MDVREELLMGASAPRLTTDQQARIDMLRLANYFGSVPSAYNLRKLVEALEPFAEAGVSDAEQEQFDALVKHVESKRNPVNMFADTSDEDDDSEDEVKVREESE